MRISMVGGLVLMGALGTGTAVAGTLTSLDAGALIIPMDHASQGDGILHAYGLVHALLREGIQVHWVIDSSKGAGDPDLVDVAAYLTTAGAGAAAPRDFAGGPFVVSAADAGAALVVLTDRQAAGWDAVAYLAGGSFDADVARTLFAAPSIALFEDGNEDIAWEYLNAAGIPDSDGHTWDASSPDNLSAEALIGPDDSVAGDGALFDADGHAAYCHVNAMHWDPGPSVAATTHAVVRELRAFARDPLTSSLFECAAAATVENDPDGGLLSSGLTKLGLKDKADWTVGDPAAELFQIDGAWGQEGGSLPSFNASWNADVITLDGDDAKDTAAAVASGRLDGDPSLGRVSLFGGHHYDVTLPWADNDQINGIRVFLNSYLTTDCGSLDSAPVLELSGAAVPTSLDVALTLDWENAGLGRARDGVLALTVDGGLAYVSDDGGGSWSPGDHRLSWDLGTLSAGDGGTIVVALAGSASGVYDLDATLDWTVAGSPFDTGWTGRVTLLLDSDGDGLSDEDEIEIHHTDPNDADSDDDGVDDGIEIEAGSDPNDPSDWGQSGDDTGSGDSGPSGTSDDSGGPGDAAGLSGTGTEPKDFCGCSQQGGPGSGLGWLAVVGLVLGWRRQG